MATKHTHQVVFGRKVDGCPRCAELSAGAEPICWNWRNQAQGDARRAQECHEHFRSHKHVSGGCGPVCTFGEW